MKIDTRLADRIKKINPSSTLAITSKAKRLKSEGKDVISFAAGEPDCDTPDFVKEAAIEAIRNGFTKYTPSTGILELKKLICEKFAKDNNLTYTPENIVVSCGAKHSIFNTLSVLVDKNDEVIIPSPYWVSYPEMVLLCEGKPRFIKTSARNNFKITAQELEKHCTARTKALILNSPSNPTGCVYSLEDLQNIAEVCAAKRLFVISDEIYEKIIFDGLKHYSIASLNKAIFDLTITVNGLSKSHSMTGWRIGYLGAPADIAAAIAKLQDHSTSNPTSISQKAAVAALAAPDDFTRNLCQQFLEKRDYLVSRVKEIKALNYILPEGAFYLFLNIERTKLDSLTFASKLLEEEFVAVIPGAGFGNDDYIRLSFATSLEQIKKGMDRMSSWISRIHLKE
jgi:aspartate aminotransferase